MKNIKSHVLMIKPFLFRDINNPDAFVHKGALNEFNNISNTLKELGVEVTILEDFDDSTPNSIFVNNWFATFPGGRIALFSMSSEERKREVPKFKNDLLLRYGDAHVKDYSNLVLSLEGEGSMVLDRRFKVAYCGISPRSSGELFNRFCKDFDYRGVSFSTSFNGEAVNHTDTIMTIAKDFIIIAESLIPEPERTTVLKSLAQTNREIISLNEEEFINHCGNSIEIVGDERYFLMSTRAYNSLRDENREAIEKYIKILPLDVDTIESVGEGSINSILAEIYK